MVLGGCGFPHYKYLPCCAALSPIHVPGVILKDHTSANWLHVVWYQFCSMLTHSDSFFFFGSVEVINDICMRWVKSDEDSLALFWMWW